MARQVAKLMKEKNWALMDIEYIQTLKNHRCIRKLYILAKDGFTEKELEFYPCIRYSQMKKRNKRAFNYCKDTYGKNALQAILHQHNLKDVWRENTWTSSNSLGRAVR